VSLRDAVFDWISASAGMTEVVTLFDSNKNQLPRLLAQQLACNEMME